MSKKENCFRIIFCLIIISLQTFAQTTWYVNNEVGSDEYDGKSLTVESDSVGPKKTIANAILCACHEDTIAVVPSVWYYGPYTSEPDTIIVSKELVLKSTNDDYLYIYSDLEINLPDSLVIKGNNVEIISGIVLLGNLILYSPIEWNYLFFLHGSLFISSGYDNLVKNKIYKMPIIFEGHKNQLISVPPEGSNICSFIIAKSFGKYVQLVGGDLWLSAEDSAVVTFKWGLFLTGENTLYLNSFSGSNKQGFIQDLNDGYISHVVGTVGIKPKFADSLEFSKTTWPVGSRDKYCPFSMYIHNPNEGNLDEYVYVSYVAGKPIGNIGLPIEVNENQITYFPEFYWNLYSEQWQGLSDLSYDMEFEIEGYDYKEKINDIVMLRRENNISETENKWEIQGTEYNNSYGNNTSKVLIKNTKGVFSSEVTMFTFGLPSRLYINKKLPDLDIDIVPTNINIEEVFGGNIGALKYSVNASNPVVLTVPNEEFYEPNFEICGLNDGNSIIYVTATDVNGDFITTSLFVEVYPTSIDDNPIVPVSYNLYQNYPNPFNPTTTIRFGLPELSRVTLVIYNCLGQEVSKLINNEELASGYHSYNFNAENLSSGVYYYKVDAGSFHVVKKMLLVK